MQETWVRFLGQEDPLEKEMATHSSILDWRIPWTEEPGGLHTVHGVARVRHDLVSKPPLAGNEGLAALTVLFHMFLKQSSHSIVPHPSRSRQNIPMQWVQVRQKWTRQINRDTAGREHYSIWCATEKSWILKKERNSTLKLLLYGFSGSCIGLQPVTLTCIIYKMGPRWMNMFESLLIWSIFCYGCNSPVTYRRFIFHYINLCMGL